MPHDLPPEKRKCFPLLTPDNYRVSSVETENYNCLAWAADDQSRWWEPTPDKYWPPNAPQRGDLQSFVRAYETLGYAVCGGANLETGFEKIALYADATGRPTHAARQLPGGNWTSKLGQWEDIEHDTVGDVEGDGPYCYGRVHTFMQRPRAT
jgi:hypothetical protein